VTEKKYFISDNQSLRNLLRIRSDLQREREKRERERREREKREREKREREKRERERERNRSTKVDRFKVKQVLALTRAH
jgi:hypothetical protein